MAEERWIEFTSNGEVFVVGENDGWTYLRHGPQRWRTPAVISKVTETPGPVYPRCWVTCDVNGGSYSIDVPPKDAEIYRHWLATHPPKT
jgi:hypothetical protein